MQTNMDRVRTEPAPDRRVIMAVRCGTSGGTDALGTSPAPWGVWLHQEVGRMNTQVKRNPVE
jgi:hypothetical protein